MKEKQNYNNYIVIDFDKKTVRCTNAAILVSLENVELEGSGIVYASIESIKNFIKALPRAKKELGITIALKEGKLWFNDFSIDYAENISFPDLNVVLNADSPKIGLFGILGAEILSMGEEIFSNPALNRELWYWHPAKTMLSQIKVTYEDYFDNVVTVVMMPKITNRGRVFTIKDVSVDVLKKLNFTDKDDE